MVEDPFGLVGQLLAGRYEVRSAVAKGGFGVVYRGRHPLLKRDVALKVLKPRGHVDAETQRVLVDTFLKEAQTIAALDHPAIVRVLDAGFGTRPARDDAPWMVLEWVEGETLADHLRARRGAGGRSPPECLALLRPVIEALGLAHAAGVAHRDIKPANVMLPIPELVARGQPRSRVLDFGIAKWMEQGEIAGSGHTETRSDFVAFSLAYAAPEQVSNARTGPWTDVHALALILTELLTDAPAYRGQDKVAVTAEVMSDARPTPARAGVRVGSWERVIARALALRPADRFADATEFLRALESSLDAPLPRETAPERLAEAPLTTPAEAILATPAPTFAITAASSPAAPPVPAAFVASRRRVTLAHVVLALALVAVPLLAVALRRRTSAPTADAPTARASAPVSRPPAPPLASASPSMSSATPTASSPEPPGEVAASDVAPGRRHRARREPSRAPSPPHEAPTQSAPTPPSPAVAPSEPPRAPPATPSAPSQPAPRPDNIDERPAPEHASARLATGGENAP